MTVVPARSAFASRLEGEAAEALRSGDALAALQAIDRRLRLTPAAEAFSHVLHAEALHRLGMTQEAIAALRRAIEVRAGDLAANRRLFAWADGIEKVEAARVLIGLDKHLPSLRACAEHLLELEPAGVGVLTVLHDDVSGWACWRSGQDLELAMSGPSTAHRSIIAGDPTHPLSELCGQAASFRIARPPSATLMRVTLSSGGVALAIAQALATIAAPFEPRRRTRATSPERRPVTVIMPIYADAPMTQACLDSLLAQAPTPALAGVILVDDASPDADVRAAAERAAGDPRVTLLRNSANLGFVGAVNRALAAVGEGDVLLLNADTIVPAGFIERLIEAAYSADDIGTVTPLSNNGEVVNFPRPDRDNPLPDPAMIERIDRHAAAVNGAETVDLPSGVGFCLYIRHDCLASVGTLREIYHRGYYEDVDFCLSAREHGFRNVCATNVFVAHAGARSFRADKRALVQANARIIARRFPEHSAETAAFMAADPLRKARARIEQALLIEEGADRLVVTGGGALALVLGEAAAAGTERMLLLSIEHGRASLGRPGLWPPALCFSVMDEAGMADLVAVLGRLGLARITLVDPLDIPLALARRLIRLAAVFEVRLSHDALSPSDPAMNGDGWQDILAAAERITVPDERMRNRLLALGIDSAIEPAARAATPVIKTGPLGFIVAGRSLLEDRLVEDIVLGLGDAGPAVLLGALDLPARLPADRLRETGPLLDADDLLLQIERHGVGALCLVESEPGFGSPPLAAARRLALPCCYVDWSGGSIAPREGDLPLASSLSLAERIEAIRRWRAS